MRISDWSSDVCSSDLARRLSTVISATSALGLVAFAPAAFAQEDPGASSDDAGEIIVTARRRDERLVDVPIAVTAISGDTLAKAGAIDTTAAAHIKIGRASCRERGCQEV